LPKSGLLAYPPYHFSKPNFREAQEAYEEEVVWVYNRSKGYANGSKASAIQARKGFYDSGKLITKKG